MMTVPSPRFKADSTASARRARTLGPAFRRSITTSMSCLICRSRESLSAIGTICPSTRARTNPARPKLDEQVLVLPLLAPDHGGENEVRRAGGQLHDPRDNLLAGLRRDGPVTVRAMPLTDPREEHAEIVIDLGDRADGRARVAPGGFLLDRDGGAQAIDPLDLRLGHLAEELPGIAGETLDVTSLPFGIKGIEGERAFARSRDPGKADERTARQVERDIAEVVLARAADHDVRRGHPWSVLKKGASAFVVGHGPSVVDRIHTIHVSAQTVHPRRRTLPGAPSPLSVHSTIPTGIVASGMVLMLTNLFSRTSLWQLTQFIVILT